MVLAAGKPWIVIPEWRYFDEQICKAQALATAGVAAVAPNWPSHRSAWEDLWREAASLDLAQQQRLVSNAAATETADWLNTLAERLWRGTVPRMEAVA